MSFIDRFERANVTVVSDDGSVTARWAVRGGMTITLDARHVRGHTEETLARKCAQAVKGMRRGYVAAMRHLLGDDYDPGGPAPDGPVEAGRRLTTELAAIKAKGVSRRGYAQARIDGDSDMEIAIRPGALRSMITLDALAVDITEAVTQAVEEYRRQSDSAHERYRESLNTPAGR